MMKDFIQSLREGILVGDGAMGTLLLSRGIRPQQSFETLVLTDPATVRSVHQEYREAGADVIETNTFGANRFRLAISGYQNQVSRINREAAGLAREAAGDEAFVAGSVGMIPPAVSPGGDRHSHRPEELLEAYGEQVKALEEGGVDVILLETFEEWENLRIAIRAARQNTSLPVIAQMSLSNRGLSIFGAEAERFCSLALEEGASVFGSNCGGGFPSVAAVLEGASGVKNVILSAYPNAGFPEMVQGRMIYPATPDYFSSRCLELLPYGVRLIGGCCGTTPRHIRALRRTLDETGATGPSRPVTEKPRRVVTAPGRVSGEGGFLGSLRRTGLPVIVEIDPPPSPDIEEVLRGALAVKKAGADAVSMAENPLAQQRVSSICAAAIIRERARIQVIPHLTTRDHNILGLQSLLMGAHLAGLEAILAVTGDPVGKGDYHTGQGVFSINSVHLIRMIDQLNRGHILSGRSLSSRTDFSIGAAFNPNAANLKAEILKLRKKVDSGANFVMTQPVFSADLVRKVLEECSDIGVRIFFGVFPLLSFRNAEFIHNEVPGITIPEDVRKRMAACSDKVESRRTGLAVAWELIEKIRGDIEGLYLVSPLNRWGMPRDLLDKLRTAEAKEGSNLDLD